MSKVCRRMEGRCLQPERVRKICITCLQVKVFLVSRFTSNKYRSGSLLNVVIHCLQLQHHLIGCLREFLVTIGLIGLSWTKKLRVVHGNGGQGINTSQFRVLILRDCLWGRLLTSSLGKGNLNSNLSSNSGGVVMLV